VLTEPTQIQEEGAQPLEDWLRTPEQEARIKKLIQKHLKRQRGVKPGYVKLDTGETVREGCEDADGNL